MDRDTAERWTEAAGLVFAGQYMQVDLAIEQGVPEALGLTPREWVETKLGGYVKYVVADRRKIHAELREKGLKLREIAERTGAGKDTVARDLKPEPVANETGQPENPQVTESPSPESVSDETGAQSGPLSGRGKRKAKVESRADAEYVLTHTANMLLDLRDFPPFENDDTRALIRTIKGLIGKGWFQNDLD